MSDLTTNFVTVRHNAGTCPACREYLWGWVVVEGRMSPPKLDREGKASVYASAKPTHMTLTHECAPGDAEDDPAAEPTHQEPTMPEPEETA